MGATWTKRGKSYRIAVHHDGERAYVTVRSEADAKALVREIHRRELAGENVLQAIKTARAQAPVAEPSTFPTVEQAVSAFIDEQERIGELRSTTARGYRSRVRTWVFPVIGSTLVNQVTREAVGAIVRKVREAGRCRALVRQTINPVRMTLQHLIETKMLPGPNPCSDLRWFFGRSKGRDQASNTQVPFFTESETRKVLEAVKHLFPRWYPFVACAFMSGMRFGELAALHRDDLDQKRGVITVSRTMSGIKVTATKTGKVRHVKVSPALVRILVGHMEAMTLDAQAANWSAEARLLMFPTTGGLPIRYRYLTLKVWVESLKAAKLVRRRFHATRHSYAANLLSAGADPRYVSEQLGHSKVTITMDVYGRWIQKSAHEHVVAALDKLVE